MPRRTGRPNRERAKCKGCTSSRWRRSCRRDGRPDSQMEDARDLVMVAWEGGRHSAMRRRVRRRDLRRGEERKPWNITTLLSNICVPAVYGLRYSNITPLGNFWVGRRSCFITFQGNFAVSRAVAKITLSGNFAVRSLGANITSLGYFPGCWEIASLGNFCFLDL